MIAVGDGGLLDERLRRADDAALPALPEDRQAIELMLPEGVVGFLGFFIDQQVMEIGQFEPGLLLGLLEQRLEANGVLACLAATPEGGHVDGDERPVFGIDGE